MTAVDLTAPVTQYRPVPFEDAVPGDRFLTQTQRVPRRTDHLIVNFSPSYPEAKRLLLERVAATLNTLLDLPHDWDGDGAEPISSAAARAALDFLESIVDVDTVVPQVFPLASGGVQLEWLIAGKDLEVESAPDGHAYVLGSDAEGKVVFERDAPDRSGPEIRAETREFLRSIMLPLNTAR